MKTIGTWILAVVAAAVLAGAPAARAQGVNPNSTQNVLPTGSPAAAATLDAQRKALFARMMQNPGDLDLAFAYAALSERAGDLEAAISTLERMLIFAPGLPRLQFELGVLYFRLGAYETAATYLRAVQDAADVPADVQSQVGLYLAAVEQRRAGSVLSGSIGVGVRVQSNANAGSSSSTISLGGLSFLLSPSAISQPDANGYIRGNLNAAIDLQSQGDRLDIALTGYGSIYRSLGTFNAGIVEAKVGPNFNLQRFSIENTRLGVYGIMGGALLGGSAYQGTLGVGSDLTILLDARSRVILRGEARYETYFDSALRPTASLRTGTHLIGSGTYEYQLTPDVALFAAMSLDRRLTGTGYLSNWVAGGQAGASYRFASPIAALTAPWTVSASAGATYLTSDAPDPTFSPTAVEQTTQVFVQGSLRVPLPNGFAADASASYMRSFSNYGLSSFDNLSASVGVSKGF